MTALVICESAKLYLLLELITDMPYVLDRNGIAFAFRVILIVIIEEYKRQMELNEIFVKSDLGKPIYHIKNRLIGTGALYRYTAVAIRGGMVKLKGYILFCKLASGDILAVLTRAKPFASQTFKDPINAQEHGALV